MCSRRLAGVFVAVGVFVAPPAVHSAPKPDRMLAAAVDRDLERPPTWAIPSDADVRDRILAWIDTIAASGRQKPADLAAARAAWTADGETEPPSDRLDRVMASFVALDDRCAAVWRAVRGSSSTATGGRPAWLDDAATDAFVRDTVCLWLGREFVRRDRFDDGLTMLADLDPTTSIDPAALLFHRAACQHWLLEADVAVETLDRLLERTGEIPVRYERVARLLRADITALEDESLDHIARRMKDITRRLDQGRAGPKTIAVQDGVIESLDKMIKAIEQQQQQSRSSGSAGAGGGGSGGDGTPMDDSRIAGGKGPGEVTKKDIGGSDGWGNLPPHRREEALQQIGREFPAHYREAIEQYFKRLAAGEEKR